MAARASRAWVLVAIGAALALAAVSALRGCRLDPLGAPGGRPGSAPAQGALTGLSLPALLGDSGGGPGGVGGLGDFLKVTAPRPFLFPADHGPHPGYRSEWWYFTGNLQDTQGRAFGYQLTFFRSGLRPPGDSGSGRSSRTSAWAAEDAYMAHFALTDVEGGRFHAHERFSRAALGLAGARARGDSGGFRVWLEDWSAASADTAFLPLRLRASHGALSLDLALSPGKPLVLQGDRGFSRKGPGAGNASHYYSFTRLPTRGSISTSEGIFPVTGASWLDREWGSSILAPGLAGWEWFALRLADSTEWMFFRLRKTGSAATGKAGLDYGIQVDARGGSEVFAPEAMTAEILSTWKSPRGRTYPARWRIAVASVGVTLDIAPVLEDQELDLSIPYWEGAVSVRATRDGVPVEGRGYMELTGY